METNVKSRRRWLRVLGWIFGGAVSLLLVAVLAGVCWLWGWQWGKYNTEVS